MTFDLSATLRICEDHFFRALGLSVHEQVIYYHLLRHTHLEGRSSVVLPLASLVSGVGLSETKVREAIRSLDQRGCVRIEDRSRIGHAISVLLPEQVEGGLPNERPAELDLEALDFYSGRRFVAALLERESGRCFYCQKQVTSQSCTLDHVRSQMAVADNSYRNIVVACHECNTLKQAKPAEDFLRELYRRSVLSQTELGERLSALQLLASGEVKPSVHLVRAAI